MLADPRAGTLATQLRLPVARHGSARRGGAGPRRVPVRGSVRGDPRTDYMTELELFAKSIFDEDRSVLEFLTAKHTYVNERVALLYGIEGVKGEWFQRVELDDSTRWGLARQRRDPDGGRLSEPHVAGAARRIHPRAHHGHAARRAAAERRSSTRGRRHAGTSCAHRSREDGGSQRQSDVFFLSRHSRSARVRARELRRRRHLARARPLRGRRSTPRGAARRHAACRAPTICARRCCAGPDQFVQTFTERLMTYALGTHDRPRGHARRCARSCATRRATIIGFRRSSAASWKASASSSGRSRTTLTAQSTLGQLTNSGERHMFITKKHLSRRTVFRGAGATIALPLLDAMNPAATAWAQTPAATRRTEWRSSASRWVP